MPNIINTKWLITGGTSGLGLALTKILIETGAKVAVVARNEKRLFDLAKTIPFIPIHADVSRKEDIYKISAQALAQLGGLDVLVNNASALGPSPLQLLLDTECEDFEKALQTNLLGAFRLTKAVLPTFLLQSRGTVVNITSDAAANAYPKWGAYGASKAALDHATRVWAEEAPGVSFYSFDPGDMDTPLHAEAVPDADREKLRKPERSARELIEWLASDPISGARRSS